MHIIYMEDLMLSDNGKKRKLARFDNKPFQKPQNDRLYLLHDQPRGFEEHLGCAHVQQAHIVHNAGAKLNVNQCEIHRHNGTTKMLTSFGHLHLLFFGGLRTALIACRQHMSLRTIENDIHKKITLH